MPLTKKDLSQIKGVVHDEVENLARIVARGFENVEKRFEQVDKRFEQVDKRLEESDKRINELTEVVIKFVKATDDNFRHVNARLDRVRDDVSDVPAIRQELQKLQERVYRLEKKA